MLFSIKNALTTISRLVISPFKDFIHKFLVVYMDNWTVYGLVKDHTMNLRLMLERLWKHHISLNMKKCIFCTPFGILLGHIVCKEGMLVDPAKITVIIDLLTPMTLKQLILTSGHTRYYHKFIRVYATITTLMEKLLKKDVKFEWNNEFQRILDMLNKRWSQHQY